MIWCECRDPEPVEEGGSIFCQKCGGYATLINEKTDGQKAIRLLREYINEYPKSEYPNVDDKLITKFCNAAKLLGINYIVLPEDDMVCPECKYHHGKVGERGISLDTHFGNNTLCIYCSVEGEYDRIMEHNMATCTDEDHKPDGSEDRDIGIGMKTMHWTKEDCRVLYEAFEKEYNEILTELTMVPNNG